MASCNKDSDGITREEINKLGEALKDDNFRKLFLEYAEEMNDPKNQKQYEEELKMFEKQRGMDVTFVHPEGVYVIKTIMQSETKKVFINMCTNKHVDKPSCSRVDFGAPGLNWNIPFLLSKPQEDVDKTGKPCLVYDIIFHADTLYMSQRNSRFCKMVEQTALDGIEEKFKIKLKRDSIQYPKMKFKGKPIPSIVRKKAFDCEVGKANKENVECFVDIDENSTHAENHHKEYIDLTLLQPKYTITHRSSLNMEDYTILSVNSPNTRPKELVIAIELPCVESISNVDLDVQEKFLTLKSSEKAAYELKLDLPFPVYSDKGSASFDGTDKILNVVLPVVPFTQGTMKKIDIIPKSTEDCEEPLNVDNSKCMPENRKLIEEVEEAEEKFVDQSKKMENNETREMNNESIDNFLEACTSKYTEEGYVNFWDFLCNQSENQVAIVIFLEKIEPSSVTTIISNCQKMLFLEAANANGKYFLGLKIPSDNSLKLLERKLDVCQENIVLTIQKCNIECLSGELHFLNGKDWKAYEFPTESSLLEKHFQLKLSHEEMMSKGIVMDNRHVSVQDIAEDSVTVSLQMGDFNKNTKAERPNKLDGILYDGNNAINYFAKNKIRTSSESSELSEDMSPMRRYRGILKNRSNWRSISESSDDFGWTSQEVGSPESDYGGCDGDKPKKSVRFSENISKTIFRANSSILGQKKKNQKKNENKKKSAAKKGRYSGTSGSESEGMSGTSDAETCEDKETEEEEPELLEKTVQEEQQIALKEENELVPEGFKSCKDLQQEKPTLPIDIKNGKMSERKIKADANESFEKLDFRTSKNRARVFDKNPDFRTNFSQVEKSDNQTPRKGKPSSKKRMSRKQGKSDSLPSSMEDADAQEGSLQFENNEPDQLMSGSIFDLD